MRKFVAALIVILMTVAIFGAIAVIALNFGAFASVFQSAGSMDPGVMQMYVSIAILLTCWVILFILLVRMQDNGGIAKYGKIDTLTWLGNRKTLKERYDHQNPVLTRYACLAYISFDASRIDSLYSPVLTEKLEKALAVVAAGICDERDFAARVDDGAFCLLLCCRDGLHARQRVSELLERMKKAQNKVLIKEIAPLTAGISLPEEGTLDFSEAFDRARLACKYADESEGGVLIYTPDLSGREDSRKRLQDKLNRAIDAGEFEPFLQFVYNLKTKTFTGAEVLSRWNSPDEGFLMPAYYINDMRSTGVIERFDLYMLEKVCSLLEEWSSHPELSKIYLSCNITRSTISSESFVEDLKRIAGKHKFPHELLVLEITEDALVDDHALAYRNIVDCKAQGFPVALDDFGSGNCSFHDINDYPVDIIKVDRQFIPNTTTKRGAALLQGLVGLAHQLDVTVVCEGVEIKKELESVERSGCDFVQGYYFSYVYSVEEAKKHYFESREK